jgi:hypothetical protein
MSFWRTAMEKQKSQNIKFRFLNRLLRVSLCNFVAKNYGGKSEENTVFGYLKFIVIGIICIG